jgi:hypothetical protein
MWTRFAEEPRASSSVWRRLLGVEQVVVDDVRLEGRCHSHGPSAEAVHAPSCSATSTTARQCWATLEDLTGEGARRPCEYDGRIPFAECYSSTCGTSSSRRASECLFVSQRTGRSPTGWTRLGRLTSSSWAGVRRGPGDHREMVAFSSTRAAVR